MTEKKLQEKILENILECGLMGRAVEWRGRKGCPDVVIIDPPTVWLELKNPNGRGRLQPSQKREIPRMKDHGANAYRIDSYKEYLEVLRRHYRPAAGGD